LTGYLSNLSRITYLENAHRAVTVNYGSASHYQIGGVCRFFIEVLFYGCFVDNRFSRQIRFIYLQRNGFEQFSIGRNLFTGFQNNDIADYDIFARNFLYTTVSDDFN